jgi:hypothetical protein
LHAHTVKTYIAYARRPVWSKQHGAYITLVTAWLIALLLSRSLSPLQPLVLLLLYDCSMQAILIAALLIIKAGMLVCLPGWYRSIRIKTIGFMETGFQVIFVILMMSAAG